VKPIAVIGAGISGLTAAYRVRQFGLPVVVYEKQNRTGGVIRSGREFGFLTESGPISLRPTSLLEQILHELNLESRRVPVNENGKKRFLVRQGKLIPVPGSPVSAITSPLLSWPAKLRLLCEPFVPKSTSQDPTLAEFVSRRLGSEVLEYAVEPLVAGMYAGVPEQLSVRQAFPKIYELEQTSGSLLRGAIARAIRSPRREKRGLPFSFSDGVEVLAHALSSSLNGSVRTRAGVVQRSRILRAGSSLTRVAPALNTLRSSSPLRRRRSLK
jgi:oxygen-dependent protoporphyrinogen oxidase